MNYAYAASTFILLTLGMSLGCHSVKTHSESRIWLSQYNLDHPLVGRIIDVKHERSINESDLVEALSSAKFVLLGEKHDNPDHHLLQSRMLGRQADLRGFDGDVDHRPNHSTRGTFNGRGNSKGIALGGQRLAFVRDLCANFQSRAQSKSSIGWCASKWEEFTTMLKQFEDGEVDLEPSARETLRTHLVAAHCGHSLASLTAYMLKAQFLKDRIMAHELRSQSGTGRGVLIAGNGHIRKDYGVPQHLDGTVSLAFVEVRPGTREVSEYDISPYDYVYFTPVVDPVDACERVSERVLRRCPCLK